MKIRFGKILSAVFGLALLSMGGGVVAGPAGLPQQMLPSYVPASPSRGVASFRPQYRVQPVRPMARYPHPVNVPPHYAPVRRHAANWPIPVSYRPIAPMPPPRFPPYGYRGAPPRWAGYPPPTGGYGVQPMPRMAYRYPSRPPVNTWGYPRPVQFRAQRPYPPMAPVYYRQPSWATPRRAVLPMPGTAYPYRQSNRYPVPGPRTVQGQFAGRYQPYSRSPGGQPDFRFRPMPRSVAYQGYPTPDGYPAAPGYSPDYRFRQGPPNHGLGRTPVWSYQAWQMPDRPIRKGEVLAWHNTAKQFSRTAY